MTSVPPILTPGHAALRTACDPVAFPDVGLAPQLAHPHATPRAIVCASAGNWGQAMAYAHRAQFAGKTVATVLCGSNVTEAQIQAYLS